MTQLVAGVIRIHTELEKTKNIQQITQKFEQILSEYNDYEEQRKRLDKLEQIAQKVKARREYLKSTQYVEDCIALVQKAYDEYREYQTKQQTLFKLKHIVGNMTTLNQSIQRIDREISQLEKEFRKLCPDECPLCGAKIRK